MKKNTNKQTEYGAIIEAILGNAEACNLAGHSAQIVTGSAELAEVLVKGFCDANTDNVDVLLTDDACIDEVEAVEEEPQTEEVEAVPVEETEEVEAVDAVAVEE